MKAFRARYVLPVASPPIENGVVHLDSGKIVQVSKYAGEACQDLGDVLLLPALVNAHTHLEFSDLDEPLGVAGMPFPDWIRAVIRARLERPRSVADRSAAIQTGIEETRRHGVSALGEIVTAPWHSGVYADSRLAGLAFFELLGLAAERVSDHLEAASNYVAQFPPDSGFIPALSPHSPYTIGIKCLQQIAIHSSAQHLTLAMHLAESPEELELIENRTGPFVELLSEMQVWHPQEMGRRVQDYLRALADGHRALVIHGNYLSAEDIEFVAGCGDRITMVYCPRTHAYFRHAPYPLGKFLESGIRVALGTDSRASSPDLSMMAELQAAATAHPDVDPQRLLRMATLDGAAALGLAAERGSITVGKVSDLITVPMTPGARDPHASLLETAGLTPILIKA